MAEKVDILKAAALFIDEEGRLLISKDIGATKWTILGGTIEPDETQIECLHREMLEELGVEIEVNPTMYAETPTFPAANDPGKTVKLHYYFCKLLSDPTPNDDVEHLHWLSKDDFYSDEFDLSSACREYLLPKLIKDKLLL